MFGLTKSISLSNVFLAFRSEFIRELVFPTIGVYGYSSYVPFIEYVMRKVVFGEAQVVGNQIRRKHFKSGKPNGLYEKNVIEETASGSVTPGKFFGDLMNFNF